MRVFEWIVRNEEGLASRVDQRVLRWFGHVDGGDNG